MDNNYDDLTSDYTTMDYDTALKVKAVLEYCEPHLDKMWASKVVGLLLGVDFRDAADSIYEFYEWYEDNY